MADDNTIQINVTATTNGLQSGLASASKQVESFGEELNTLAARAQAIKPDAFKAVAQALNEGKIDQDEFRDGLIGITTAQSAAAKEAVNLAEKSALSSGALRELTVVGRELASGNLTRLPGSLSILATRLGGIPPQAILAAGAVAAFGYAIYEVIDSSEKFEADLAKIQNAFTAVGAGDQFDRTQITQYLADLRQIPGVTEDAATSMVNELARANNGTRLLAETTRDLKPLADTLGIELPQAAKLLAGALNDPAKAIEELRRYGIELTASQQEQVREFMAVNDTADATRVVLDALAASFAHVADTSTPLQHLGQDIRNSLSGVNEDVDRTSSSLDRLATRLAGFGPAGVAFAASAEAISQANRLLGDRNVPNADWSGSVGTMADGDRKQTQADKAEQIRKENEAIDETNKRFVTGNSLLAEQEAHKRNLVVIQRGIDAAQEVGDQKALQRATIDLETENKRYFELTQPKQPKDDSDKVAEAQAKAEAEAGDARIKTEQDVVEEKLRLGQISSAEAVSQLKDLAAQEHAINVKRIADMRAVYARQGDRAGMATADGDTVKENERYSQQDSKIDTQGAQATQKAQQAEIEGDRRVADAKSQSAMAAMQEKVRLGQASAQEEIEFELQTLNAKHAADDAAFDALASSYSKDSAAYIKAQKDKEVANQKWLQEVGKLNTDVALKTQQDWQKTVQPITRAFDTSIQGMVMGTQTLHQAVGRIGQSIVGEFASNAEKMVEKWLISEFMKTAATDAGAAARELAENAGTNASVENNIANTEKQQSTDAVGVYSSVFNYLAPELGPFAAVPAALAAASVMALSLPSAAGGMIVQNDTLAMVHENEMVLPARYTSGLTNMIDSANAGQGAGQTNHFHVNVAAQGRLNADDLDGLHDAVVGSLKKAARNGQFGGMRSA